MKKTATKRIWIAIGRAMFWVSLPLLHVYLKRRPRTRVLVMVDGRVLVVKGWLSDGSWSLPGGGLRRLETPEQGACRELKEETGIELRPSVLTSLGVASQKQHGLHFAYHMFWAVLPRRQKLTLPKVEIVEACYLPLDQLTVKSAQAHVLDTLAAWRAQH